MILLNRCFLTDHVTTYSMEVIPSIGPVTEANILESS